DPEYNVSPAFLIIGSDSPVNSDSLTSTEPSLTTASTIICLPDASLMMSSITTSSIAISCSSASRTTTAVGADSSDNLSIIFLALTSCKIPMIVLIAAINSEKVCMIDAPLQTSSTTIAK